MKELGPAAREFVDAHRKDKVLADAARARIKQKLMLRLSTAGATAAGGTGTAAGMSLAAKVVLVAVGVAGVAGAGSLAVRALRSRTPARVTPAEASRPMVSVGVTTAPAAAPVPDRSPPTAPTLAAAPRTPPPVAMTMPARASGARARGLPRGHEPPRPVVAAPASSVAIEPGRREPPKRIDERPTPPPADSPAAVAPLGEAFDPELELRAVREAREDLRAGRPASAYRRLEELDRQSPGGMLAQERSALSAIALCRAQPGREAQDRAAAFLRRSPQSPLAAHVKSACEPGRAPDRDGSW